MIVGESKAEFQQRWMRWLNQQFALWIDVSKMIGDWTDLGFSKQINNDFAEFMRGKGGRFE